jgi:hypothetical protein
MVRVLLHAVDECAQLLVLALQRACEFGLYWWRTVVGSRKTTVNNVLNGEKE